MEKLYSKKSELENKINQLLSQKIKGRELDGLEDQLYLVDCNIRRCLKEGS